MTNTLTDEERSELTRIDTAQFFAFLAERGYTGVVALRFVNGDITAAWEVDDGTCLEKVATDVASVDKVVSVVLHCTTKPAGADRRL